jgi:magnesium transporter
MIITEKIFDSFTWIDIENPENEDLSAVTNNYQLNYYLLKDSLEKGHLPKFEKNLNTEFFIFRAYTSDVNLKIDEVGEMSNKIAFFIFEDKMITIHRAPFAFLKITQEKDIAIKELFLKLVSFMIGSFKKPTEDLANKIDAIEKTIFLKDPRNILLEELYYIKSQSRILKKVLQITQTVIDRVVEKYSNSYLYQDIMDTLLSLVTSNEEAVENSNQLMNAYLSINNQKNNEIVRLLTIFSAFFLPLTFIVGLYGMNFKFIPELEWHGGYYYSLILMVLIIIIIYIWFRKKKII